MRIKKNVAHSRVFLQNFKILPYFCHNLVIIAFYQNGCKAILEREKDVT